jgi:hypothetical protein
VTPVVYRTPRLVFGLEQMARYIHTQQFKDTP